MTIAEEDTGVFVGRARIVCDQKLQVGQLKLGPTAPLARAEELEVKLVSEKIHPTAYSARTMQTPMGGLSPRSIIGEDHVAPVAVFGASNRIPKRCLAALCRKACPRSSSTMTIWPKCWGTVRGAVDGYGRRGGWLFVRCDRGSPRSKSRRRHHGSIEQQFRCRPVESYGYRCRRNRAALLLIPTT